MICFALLPVIAFSSRKFAILYVYLLWSSPTHPNAPFPLTTGATHKLAVPNLAFAAGAKISCSFRDRAPFWRVPPPPHTHNKYEFPTLSCMLSLSHLTSANNGHAVWRASTQSKGIGRPRAVMQWEAPPDYPPAVLARFELWGTSNLCERPQDLQPSARPLYYRQRGPCFDRRPLALAHHCTIYCSCEDDLMQPLPRSPAGPGHRKTQSYMLQNPLRWCIPTVQAGRGQLLRSSFAMRNSRFSEPRRRASL
jgi:hypothetical protein